MAGEPYDTTRVFTLPNILSFVRLLVGIPLLVWLILGEGNEIWAVTVLAVGGATDWLDGHLARRWKQRSRLGQVLDPLADRLYTLAILVGFVVRGDIIPWWLAVLLVGRDVLMGVALWPALRRRGYSSLPVHFLGKAATFLLLYAFPVLLLGAGEDAWQMTFRIVGWALVLWGTVLYWGAGVLYLRQGIGVIRRIPPLNRPAVTASIEPVP